MAAWNEEVLRRLSAIVSGTGQDLTPYLTTGNTNTGNTVSQLQAANTNLNTINTTSAATNTALATTNSTLSTINANTALVAWQEGGLKTGTLYIAARYTANAAASSNIDSIVLVGSKPILLYARNIGTTGSSVNSAIFLAPTYTGGTAGTVYSTNRVTVVAPTLSFLTGATVTATGTQVVPTSYMLSGSGGLLGGNTGGAGAIGAPIYLPANTTYLFRVTNSDTTASNIYSQILFYEGTI